MRVLSGSYQSTNVFFGNLPHEEFDAVRPFMFRVRLVPGQSLVEPGQIPEHVFFIEEGIASVFSNDKEGVPDVQIAMIGREGIAGALTLLGNTAQHAGTVVHMRGQALRISVANLLLCLEQCPVLRDRCFKYIQDLTEQVMSTAVSNVRNTLIERCARWLLMTHERLDGNDLFVTHEAMSTMLGVRRSGVTVATTTLQEAGLILTRRGRIQVLDRSGLEDVVAGTPIHACGTKLKHVITINPALGIAA